MKANQSGPIIIFISFILVLCLIWPMWMILGKYMDNTNYENRNTAEKPELSFENYSNYPKKFENYFNDRIPFRNELIQVNSMIDYYLFNRASNYRVLVGEDNWLFYKKKSDGDPIACYDGTNMLSEDDLQKLAQNCVTQRDLLSEDGVEFVIMIVPNKERMYSEFMPDSYGNPAEEYRALQIVEYLRSNTDLRVVYPFEELIDVKQSIPYNIYYKTDTHWNYLGGYVGAIALLNELGIEMPALSDEKITVNEGEEVSGDLAALLNLSNRLKKFDREYSVSGYDTHNVQNLEWDFNNMASYIATDADPRVLYMCRDSFGSQIGDYIGSQFAETYLRHMNTYTYDDYEKCNPNIFVYEVSERHADELEYFAVK